MNTKFDIFISFKATENGVDTRDKAVATELYHQLAARGYKVFFSAETLVRKGASDYTKEIDMALDQARMLIVVSTKLDYISTRWVEYEWKTFNADILSNVKTDAQLVTFTSGIDTRDLPRILRYVQNFPHSEQEALLTFVEAFFSGAVVRPAHSESEPRPVPALNAVSADDHTLYDSAYSGEFEMLRLRARRSYAMDRRAIDQAKSRMNRDKYNVLVLGCAYGFLAETRFGLDDDIDQIICVDKNRAVIERAGELYTQYPYMHFHPVDIQAEGYVADIRQIMDSHGIDGFDMVFAADLFRHLNDPQKTIRNTRKLLRDDGVFLIRDCDDSNKMAYPDRDDVLAEVVDCTERAPGMPNFYVGRELPLLIRNSGFAVTDVQMDIHTTLNLSFEEKEEFFLSTFGSRKNIARQILDKENVQKGELHRLVKAIDRMESLFYDTHFWYSESNMLFVAQKG